MAYTPELTQQDSATLRRIAWALETPMTKAMAEIFQWLTRKMDKKAVCEACRDNTICNTCPFFIKN